MKSAEIAGRFLRFFEERGHTIVPSASLIAEDPTLLLVNAGMVPFKPYFLAQRTPPYPRAATAQKCVRTVDIDEVGKTARHASFLQMLGNFSFGDYFKEKAVPYAWELLTLPQHDGGFGFPEDSLWVTIYHNDEEAFRIWRDTVGVSEERIQRRGVEDNYWDMGVPGPCGPCSEIFYDRGPAYGAEGGPVVDEERYLEIWNLVFMQYERGEATGPGKGDFEILGELPQQNIDTGLGLERLAALLQGVDNLYEVDSTRPILDRAAELTGHRYGDDSAADVSLRIIADHMRAATMLVSDGVLPSNEGRGYVLRRILRRSVRNLRILGGEDRGGEGSIHELVATTIDALSPLYPELERDAERIHAVADAEEASFSGTLRTGTALFESAVSETRARGARTLPGERAFTLHDTYGFPIDLTLEMAAEHGLDVDEEGFRRLMAEQRERAKADAAARKTGLTELEAYREVATGSGMSAFTGYDEIASEAMVTGLLAGGVSVPAARAGQDVELVLDRTPFYPEGGGQLADHGRISVEGGAEVRVRDVQTPVRGLIVHRATVSHGEVTVGLGAYAEVDRERRRAVSRSHTATHMTHQAFRRALGQSAAQAGSENSPGRFRFDFTSPSAVPPSVLGEVESEINATLTEDHEVRAFTTSYDEARSMGALALFGEKYGDEVRIVEVGDYARELCGGTHAGRSGQLGLVKLLNESSIGAGVRRVEALVGMDAYQFLARENLLVSQLAEQLKVRREDLPERVEAVVSRLREADKEIERLRSAQVLEAAPGLAEKPADVRGAAVVTYHAPGGTAADDMRKLALDVRGRIHAERPCVVAIAGAPKDRPSVVVAVNQAGRDRELRAGDLVGLAAKGLGGGGGGRDDLAQGGGSDPEAVDEALRVVENAVAERIS